MCEPVWTQRLRAHVAAWLQVASLSSFSPQIPKPVPPTWRFPFLRPELGLMTSEASSFHLGLSEEASWQGTHHHALTLPTPILLGQQSLLSPVFQSLPPRYQILSENSRTFQAR